MNAYTFRLEIYIPASIPTNKEAVLSVEMESSSFLFFILKGSYLFELFTNANFMVEPSTWYTLYASIENSKITCIQLENVANCYAYSVPISSTNFRYAIGNQEPADAAFTGYIKNLMVILFSNNFCSICFLFMYFKLKC
jgi:hypothetical protein